MSAVRRARRAGAALLRDAHVLRVPAAAAAVAHSTSAREQSVTLGSVLHGLAEAAHAAGGLIPGGGPIAGAVAAALGLAGDIAAAGQDPVAEIRRIRATRPELDKIHAGWAAARKARRT